MARRLPTGVRSLVRHLVANYQPEKVILFGSHALGRADRFSDVDLLVIKQTVAPFVTRLGEVARAVPPGAPKADIFVYTPEEFRRMRHAGNPFLRSALRRSIVIYEAPRR